jgi:hypothetical protein
MILLPLVVPPDPTNGDEYAGEHVPERREQLVDNRIVAQLRFVHVSLRGEPESLALSYDRRGYGAHPLPYPVPNPGGGHLLPLRHFSHQHAYQIS